MQTNHVTQSIQISMNLPSNVTRCHHPLPVHHDTLWLIVDHFAVTFTFPCTFVLFECIIPVQNITFIWINTRTYIYQYNFENWQRLNYFFHGKTQIPQHFSIPLRAFSASIISARILSIFSSIRSNCSVWQNYCT